MSKAGADKNITAICKPQRGDLIQKDKAVLTYSWFQGGEQAANVQPKIIAQH